MKYEHLASLEAYLGAVEAGLLGSHVMQEVCYPRAATAPWNGNALMVANEELLVRTSNAANLYALFTSSHGDGEPALRYIGKTTKKLARQRLTNHLFKKDPRTGSKLDLIMNHVCSGGTVHVAWVGIHTESLRNYLEEELIVRHPEADWNRENRRQRRD